MNTISIGNSKEKELHFRRGQYHNGTIYIGAHESNGDLWEDITVNLNVELPKNAAYINADRKNVVEIIEQLKKKELVSDMNSSIKNGYVTYPLYVFLDEFVEKWCIEVE